MPEIITQKKVRVARADGSAADTSKQLQVVTDQLTAARVHQATCELACAEKIADGEDATEAAAELQRSESTVKQLEAAAALLSQRNEAAQMALDQAERQEKIQKEVEATARVKRALKTLADMLKAVEQHTVDEVGPALVACAVELGTSGIRPGELNFLNEAPLVIKQHASLALHTVTKEGYVPPNMLKYQHCDECVPDDEFVRSMKRFG